MFKDRVCNMMVDERTAKHVSEAAGGRKVYFVLQPVNHNLRLILENMAIKVKAAHFLE